MFHRSLQDYCFELLATYVGPNYLIYLRRPLTSARDFLLQLDSIVNFESTGNLQGPWIECEWVPLLDFAAVSRGRPTHCRRGVTAGLAAAKTSTCI